MLPVLRDVNAATARLNIEYVLAGAAARDLMLVNAFGIYVGRATRDIDFGIAVENWQQFSELKASLLARSEFREAKKIEHRLLYRVRESDFEIPVDLIPFGGIASDDGRIEWPPAGDIVMSVAGFREALDSAIWVRVEHGLDVPVTSLPALIVLKLVAWQDRHNETNKDAADLARILETYADAGNVDRIFEHEMELLEEVGFDLELAAAIVLGQDAARICRETTLRRIVKLLASEPVMEQLGNEMVGAGRNREKAPRVFDLLARLRAGFLRGAGIHGTSI